MHKPNKLLELKIIAKPNKLHDHCKPFSKTSLWVHTTITIYENEIDEQLLFVYDSEYDDKDLNLVSLRFYLLRKNGYDVPSGKASFLV